MHYNKFNAIKYCSNLESCYDYLLNTKDCKAIAKLNVYNRTLVFNHLVTFYGMHEPERQFEDWVSSGMKNREKCVMEYYSLFKLLLDTESIHTGELELYKDVDLSIPVYTIKSVLNLVYNVSDFSNSSFSYDINYEETEFTKLCIELWKGIWWHTDTGVYSKEQLEFGNVSQYHKECNKMSTILREYKCREEYLIGEGLVKKVIGFIKDGLVDEEYVPSNDRLGKIDNEISLLSSNKRELKSQKNNLRREEIVKYIASLQDKYEEDILLKSHEDLVSKEKQTGSFIPEFVLNRTLKYYLGDYYKEH